MIANGSLTEIPPAQFIGSNTRLHFKRLRVSFNCGDYMSTQSDEWNFSFLGMTRSMVCCRSVVELNVPMGMMSTPLALH